MSAYPRQIAERLKAAAATPVGSDNGMARRIAIDAAIAWCKRTFPLHFQGDDYVPPEPTKPRLRGRPPKSKADRPGD